MPDRTTRIAAPETLVEGQRLDQPTFHTLYTAMPPGTRAELIDGLVYMPSPVGRAHGRAHVPVLLTMRILYTVHEFLTPFPASCSAQTSRSRD
jgi:hypothetical protein